MQTKTKHTRVQKFRRSITNTHEIPPTAILYPLHPSHSAYRLPPTIVAGDSLAPIGTGFLARFAGDKADELAHALLHARLGLRGKTQFQEKGNIAGHIHR